ncbi:MAG: flagellar biosynthesis anti-sigma factor FlgM [Phycisphaerales bacterium]|nr:MAG: flagellar biosynthesis anti-sigma factor FlgM [Phycisphaerales bacterium]
MWDRFEQSPSARGRRRRDRVEARAVSDISRVDVRMIGRTEAVDLRADRARPGTDASGPSRVVRESDRAELSDRARLLGKARELPDVRLDLVQRVRSEIASGQYDTPEKLETALDQMFDEEQRWPDA